MSLRERFLAFAQTADDHKGPDNQVSALSRRLTEFTSQEQKLLFATIVAGMSEGPIITWQGLLEQSNFTSTRMNELFRDPNLASYVVMGCNKVMNFNPEILR